MDNKVKPAKTQTSAMNAMTANFNSTVKGKKKRFNAVILHDCMEQISEENGQSMRYVMCKLIESGLMCHPEYKEKYERMVAESRR